MRTKKEETGNPRDEVVQVQKKICSRALIYAIVIAVVCIFFFDEKAVGKGLLLGTLFSIINFALMGRLIPMTLGKMRRKASMAGVISILCRYGVLAIPLILAIKLDAFNFVAVVVGIFAVQVVALVEYTVIQRMSGME